MEQVIGNEIVMLLKSRLNFELGYLHELSKKHYSAYKAGISPKYHLDKWDEYMREYIRLAEQWNTLYEMYYGG